MGQILFLCAATMLFIGTFWMLYLIQPLGISTVGLFQHNLGALQHTASSWFIGNDHNTLHSTANIHARGFYPASSAEHFSEMLCQTSEGSIATHTIIPLDLSVPSCARISTTPVNREQRDRHDQSEAFHHAYPVHAGTINKNDKILHIKLQLERCAENLLMRLTDEGLQITSGFEFALHECKATIDTALLSLYPPLKDKSTGLNSILTQSVTVDSGVPRSIHRKHGKTSALSHEVDNSQVQSNSSSEYGCLKNPCDWVSPTNLDRCYHRNETDWTLNGKVSYTNKSVDDFKDQAPLECELCLPHMDPEDIEQHCKRVSAAEKSTMKHLLIASGVMMFVAITAILIKVGRKRYRSRVRNNNEDGLPLERLRVPVMPTARSSAVRARGGRIDKRTISNPVLISRPAESIEGAFENPRAAPLPPSA